MNISEAYSCLIGSSYCCCDVLSCWSLTEEKKPSDSDTSKTMTTWKLRHVRKILLKKPRQTSKTYFKEAINNKYQNHYDLGYWEIWRRTSSLKNNLLRPNTKIHSCNGLKIQEERHEYSIQNLLTDETRANLNRSGGWGKAGWQMTMSVTIVFIVNRMGKASWFGQEWLEMRFLVLI